MRQHKTSIPAYRALTRIVVTGALTALLVLLSCTRPAGAEDKPTENTAHPLSAEDLSSFMDGLIPVLLQRDDIAGAVIAVVKDGKLLFAGGYGYSDVDSRKPVSPETTLFRTGSISKLFTCTAVMQLFEQSKIDLDTDINQYLDFEIPATYAEPITLRNLLTHTAGFQESMRGHFIPNGGPPVPLKIYLPENLPPRIFAPGTTPAYSNYGNTLAGYIVERVSGEPFEEYVEKHIFRPLDMKHSTYRQPLPNELKPLMSSGYSSGSEPAKPFDVVQTFPGGGLSASAEDIAHFMIAQLQDGSFGDDIILKPETAKAMHARQFCMVESMNGSTIGFAEQKRNGYRIIGHGGDLGAFHSQLFLVPALKLGFFFSQNSTGRSTLRTTIWRSFFDRYFPAPPHTEESSRQSSTAAELAGFYKTSRRFDHSIFKLNSLLGQSVVSVNPDGTIRSDLITELGRPQTLHEVEPMKYCEKNEQDCIAFKKDQTGLVQVIVDFPQIVFQRVPWYENRTVNLILLSSITVVFALTLALWPASAIIRRHYGTKLELSQQQRRRRILVIIVCAIDLGFLVTGRLLFLKLPDSNLEIWVHLLQAVGIAGAIATLVVVYDAVVIWTEPRRWWVGGVASVVRAIACLGFVCFSLVWHLFDFSHW